MRRSGSAPLRHPSASGARSGFGDRVPVVSGDRIGARVRALKPYSSLFSGWLPRLHALFNRIGLAPPASPHRLVILHTPTTVGRLYGDSQRKW